MKFLRNIHDGYGIKGPKDITDVATSIGYFCLVWELLPQILYFIKTQFKEGR